MPSRKPLYENIGIGTIVKRIGECTALNNDYHMSVLLTQQTPREDECRDLCITVGSKILVIDFKSPDKITSSERVYLNVRTRISGLESILGSDNLLLGLLHATLRVTPQWRRKNGYFLHIATPMTTVFVPLSKFNIYLKGNSSMVRLGNIRIRDVEYYCSTWPCLCEKILNYTMNSEREIIVSASRPSCYYSRDFPILCRLCSLWLSDCIELLVRANCCISCGGLCDVILRGIIDRYPISEVRGYTLASLLWMIRSCKLGYRIENIEERDKILEHLYTSEIRRESHMEDERYEYAYMLSYTPGIGFQVISLNTFTDQSHSRYGES